MLNINLPPVTTKVFCFSTGAATLCDTFDTSSRPQAAQVPLLDSCCPGAEAQRPFFLLPLGEEEMRGLGKGQEVGTGMMGSEELVCQKKNSQEMNVSLPLQRGLKAGAVSDNGKLTGREDQGWHRGGYLQGGGPDLRPLQ